MANIWIRKLGMGMSIVMTVSQLCGMFAFASENTDFGDRFEEKTVIEEDYIESDYSGRSAHALKRVQRMGVAV